MKYRAVPGYVLRQFLDEWLLIPVDNLNDPQAQMAIMNPTGQFLWEQLQQERTLSELAEAMCREFEVEQERATTDIRQFLEELDNKHCIVKMEE